MMPWCHILSKVKATTNASLHPSNALFHVADRKSRRLAADLLCLKANCFGLRRWWASRKHVIFDAMRDSKTLPGTTTDRRVVFCISSTVLLVDAYNPRCFRSDGHVLVERHFREMMVRGVSKLSRAVCNRWVLMLSGPSALLRSTC